MWQLLDPILSGIYTRGKLILVAWFTLILLTALGLYWHPPGTRETELSGAQNTEAAQVQKILTQHFNLKLGGTAAIVLPWNVSTEGLADFLTQELPEIQRVEPVNTDKAHQLQLLKVVFKPNYALTTLQEATPRLRRSLKQWNPRAQAQVTGSTAFQYDTRAESKKDSQRSESLAFLVSLGVLILTFGALSTAILPLIMGGAVLLLFHGIMAYFEAPLSPVSRILTSLVGLALSVDYALFIVSRFREERSAGAGLTRAWQISLGQAGQTILFSGLIMLVSLSALLIPDVSLSRHLMGHLMLIIVLALFHALVVLPLLLVYGDRWWHWPAFLSRWIDNHRQHSQVRWHRFSSHVVHHAGIYFTLSLLFLGLLIWPLQSFRIWSPVNAIAPRQAESTQAYNALQQDHWGGELLPIIAVYKTENVFGRQALAQLYDIHHRIARSPDVYRVQSLVGEEPLAVYQTLYNSLQSFGFFGAPTALRQVALPENPTYTLLYVFPKNTQDPNVHQRIMADLGKQQHELKQGELLRGGVVARVNDFTHELYRELPLMLGLIVGGVLLLLGWHLKSIVLPLKAALINFAPILGAFGILVLVFQWGWGQTLLHSAVNGAITNTVPLILFCLVFGLSMDYEVLMLGRIHEHYMEHGKVKPAIIEGLAQSGSLITSAVLILLGVFLPGCFSSSSQTQEICIGIVSAMILDATLVRLFLVPSFMTLMGHWNWWPHRHRSQPSQSASESAAEKS